MTDLHDRNTNAGEEAPKGSSPLKDSFDVSLSFVDGEEIVEDSYDSFDDSENKRNIESLASKNDEKVETEIHNEANDSFDSIPDSIPEQHGIDVLEASPPYGSAAGDSSKKLVISNVSANIKLNEPLSTDVDSFNDGQATPSLERPAEESTILEEPIAEEKGSRDRQASPPNKQPELIVKTLKKHEEYDSFDDSPLKEHPETSNNLAMTEKKISNDSTISKQATPSEQFQGFVCANGDKISINPKLLEESKRLLFTTLEGENCDPTAGDDNRFESPQHQVKSYASFSSTRSGFNSPVFRSFPSPNPLSAKRGRYSASTFRSPLVMKTDSSPAIKKSLSESNFVSSFEPSKLPGSTKINGNLTEPLSIDEALLSLTSENFFLIHELSKNNCARKAIVKIQIMKFLTEPFAMFCQVCESCECEMNVDNRCPRCKSEKGKYRYSFEVEINDSSMTILQCRFGDDAGRQLFDNDADVKHKLMMEDIDKWYADISSTRGKYFLLELNILRNPKRAIYIARGISHKMDHDGIAQIVKQKISAMLTAV
ncbi:unnamed protein product, partial [Mesorhabditis belari]|uniref:Uncharacterized protein n=1 Tax=Mesorhabditis belari TaxID=2138241 RepID=A0AAF3FEZ5_9BILA